MIIKECLNLNKMKSFEELEVWKSARDIRIEISKLVKSFPDFEKYRLNDQIVRSSRSVSANIAEGYGRYHYQENIQFCRQARGSLFETLDHLICALDEGYIQEELFEHIKYQIFNCLKILNGYLAYLRKQKSESK